jgi:hypothetical protein
VLRLHSTRRRTIEQIPIYARALRANVILISDRVFETLLRISPMLLGQRLPIGLLLARVPRPLSRALPPLPGRSVGVREWKW